MMAGLVGCFWPIFFFADQIPGRVTLRPALTHRPEMGCHAPCAKTWIQVLGKDGHKRGPGRNWTRTCSASYRGSPGLDSGPLGWPLFRRRTARSAPVLLFGRKRGTRKSRLETKTENKASSGLLARLWCHLPLQNPANRVENLIRLCSATIGQTGWRMGQFGATRSRLETLKNRAWIVRGDKARTAISSFCHLKMRILIAKFLKKRTHSETSGSIKGLIHGCNPASLTPEKSTVS